jgi:nucleoside-diphosphate-sugar epimerase
VGEVRTSLADVSLAADVLGYEPRVSFEAGLERTVAWFTENGVPESTAAVDYA